MCGVNVNLFTLFHCDRSVHVLASAAADAYIGLCTRARCLALFSAAHRCGYLCPLGGEVRFNRTLFMEEIGKDYVRTARSKGLSEARVLLGHVLRNALIPILSASVAVIPLLFMGSLITESFFAIPGLGSYLIEAISGQDFAIVRAMVFIGSFLYILGLILTDISYTLADPRIRLQ